MTTKPIMSNGIKKNCIGNGPGVSAGGTLALDQATPAERAPVVTAPVKSLPSTTYFCDSNLFSSIARVLFLWNINYPDKVILQQNQNSYDMEFLQYASSSTPGPRFHKPRLCSLI